MGDETTALTLETAREVRKAWERFMMGDETHLEKVRPVIRESWQRSRSLGVDPALRKLPTTLDPEELSRRCQQNAHLLQAGREVFAFLSQLLTVEAFSIGITDREGNLLYSDCPPHCFAKREEINGFPGVGMQEGSLGTNAAAMALRLDQPFQVYWHEHYVEMAHDAGGGAIPIHGSCGDTLGIIGIAGYGEFAHPRLFKLVAFVAGLFEEKIRHFEDLIHFEVLKEFNRYLLKFPESPLLALCPHGRILALSQSMAKLVTLQPPERLIGKSLRDVRDFHFEGLFPLTGGDSSEPYESFLVFPQKEKVSTSTIIPVAKEGQRAGLVVIASSLSKSVSRTGSKPSWQSTHTFSDLIGDAPTFRSAVELARQAANHDWPILLVGESGTGKELFAQAIHRASCRRLGPFVALNLSTLPKDLVASELFGYEEGAFSGAQRGGKRGKVELAHGGTLFLDELGDMPAEIQAGLLRFLEEGQIVALGSERPRRVDVRVIAAMNVDPAQAVEQGRLRLDLFHRLNVFRLVLPPLRERREDLPQLVRHLLDREGFSDREVAPEVMELFRQYAWPGNIRELRNVLISAAVRASQRLITPDMLPPELLAPKLLVSQPPASSRRVGREQLQQALAACGGNITQAARLLHIDRVTFHRKLRRYGLTRDSVAPERPGTEGAALSEER
jgi:transcriptional regulator of acetoin/glycerol metabolism